VCITTDLWSNSNTESFMGITAHYIDRDIMLRHWTIALRYIDDTHTAEHLFRHLYDILEEFNIENKVKFACTDTAANMKKAISLFGSRNVQWLPCTCHLLNLSAQDLFEGRTGDNTINQLVSKIRRFVTSFRHSGFLQKALKDKQIAVNAPVKIKLVQDVSTRWNSVYDIFHSIFVNRTALESLISDRNLQKENKTVETINKYFPTPGEFVILHDLLCLLKPLKELTVEFSAFKYSNCSILFPTIYCLINQYEFDLNTHEVLEAKDTLLSSLASRFNYILAGDQRNLFMAITFLDYRFKNFDFVTDVQVRAR
jgi:hypothetical protein